MKKIAEYKILDHGVEHCQYFEGCGVAFTEFDECFTGSGNSFKEALDDACEQMYQNEVADSKESHRLEREVLNANDECTIPKNEKEYKVKFLAHNGMTVNIDTFDNLEEARQVCAEYIASMRRRGVFIAKNDTYNWEFETKSNREGFAITDNDGILVLELPDENEPEYVEDVYHYVSIRVKWED